MAMTALRTTRDWVMPDIETHQQDDLHQTPAKNRDEGDQVQQSRKGIPGVDKALDHHVGLAAKISGKPSHQRGNHHRDQAASQAHTE